MKLIVLLTLGLISGPAIAQETFAVGAAIRNQDDRVQAAHRYYIQECFPSEVALDKQVISMDCTSSQTRYELETNILIRLIHGDMPLNTKSTPITPTMK